jgi:hypothetical protein
MRLGAASPAASLIAATGEGCAVTDQRSVSRPRGAGCDAGAYELAPPDVSSGSAILAGQTAASLVGSVAANGIPTAYRFEYGTDASYGASTAPAGAGSTIAAVAVAADVTDLEPNRTYHFRLVASNADGETIGADHTFTTAAPPEPPPSTAVTNTTPGPTPAPDTLAPVIGAVSIRPARIIRSSTLSFTLSEPARVAVAIQRRIAGRRVGGRCVKPTRRNRRAPACSRYDAATRFAFQAAAGTTTRRLSARIGPTTLTPGGYRVTLLATDATGNRARPATLAIRVGS